MTRELPKIKGWLARNKTGYLYLYEYDDVVWRDDIFEIWRSELHPIYIPNDSFPEIKWEDEPVEVELLIKKL